MQLELAAPGQGSPNFRRMQGTLRREKKIFFRLSIARFRRYSSLIREAVVKPPENRQFLALNFKGICPQISPRAFSVLSRAVKMGCKNLGF